MTSSGSKGYLIHAFNNQEIDYGTMAMCSASLIKKNLKTNSTCLVASKDTIDWILELHGKSLVGKCFDNIIEIEKDYQVSERAFKDTRYSIKNQPYYNTSRVDTWNLSPYDETILIDADYMVLDDSLDCAWGSSEDLLVNRSIRDLRHAVSPLGFDSRFNEMSIPLYWATVMYFQKTPRTQAIFELMRFIKENYRYYQRLYQFSPNGYYRNDYALSIALHMISGQVEASSVSSLPFSEILVSTEYDDMIDFKDGYAYFVSEAEQGQHLLHKVGTNIHVMNKWSVVRQYRRIFNYAQI